MWMRKYESKTKKLHKKMSGRNKGRRAFETEGTQHICSVAERIKGEQALKCQSLRSLVGL